MTKIDKTKIIAVTGSTGFLGRNLVSCLEKNGYKNLVLLSSDDYDLLEQMQVRQLFAEHNPDIVIHLAALVGGIKANMDRPADFFYQNLIMQTMVMHEANKAGVKKYLTCIGGCSYPSNAPSPIKEDEMWNGYPQPESAGYSISKKMNIVQAQVYREQYGFNAVVTVPGNIYGPHDNFSLTDSHVIPALIRKIHEAKLQGTTEIHAWGTGSPVRDFVYVKDVANALVKTLEKYDGKQFFNISSGHQVTIKKLYECVANLMDFSGRIVWDTDKPDGQMLKGFDVTLMNELIGFKCRTSLIDGLKETIDWFIENYNKQGCVRL